jgi:nucleotide-binding universal stress UspA family protein
VTYKTILVHLDSGKRRRQRLDLAFTLAEKYDAHLVGFFGLENLTIPPTPEAAPVLLETMLELRREASEEAEQAFRDKMSKEGYAAKSEWFATLGDGFAELQHRARYADLVIAGQPESNGGVPPWFSRELVMSIGRPVLYVPRAGRFDDCGERVLIPWNASREAARALEDGLPFLQRAGEAEVVTFDEDRAEPQERLPDPDVGAFLARHDAKVTVAAQPAPGIDIGSAILGRATENGADLIVMGAYSHSRLRELVLGGATRFVFESMSVPTLMSR